MRIKLDLGERWGCVEVVEIGEVESNPYDARSVVKNYTLRCDCGQEFEVDSTGWEGKRKTMDCGCGRAEDAKNMPVVTSVYMRLSLRKAIDRYARDERISRNAAINEILKTVLEAGGYEK